MALNERQGGTGVVSTLRQSLRAGSGTWPSLTLLFVWQAVFQTRDLLTHFWDTTPHQPPKAGTAWHYQGTCVFLCAQYMLFLNDLRLYLVPYLVPVGWFLPCNLTFQLLSMGTSTQYFSVFLACHHLSCSNFLLACQHPWKQTSHTSNMFGSHSQALSCLPWLLEGPLEDPTQPLGNLLAKVFSNKDMD